MSELNIEILNANVELIEELKLFYSSYYDKSNRIFIDDYLEWLLIDNPVDIGKCVSIKLNNEIIANMFLIPIVLTKQGCDKKSVFVVDVLTHPKHRDKNLFVKMIRALICYAKENKLLIVGHPNKLSTPGWKRTKMNFNQPIRSYMSKLSFWSKDIKKESINNEDKMFILSNCINDILNKSDNLIVKTNCDYLKWKYLDNPVKKYNVRAIFNRDIFVGVVVSYKLKFFIDRVVHYLIKKGSEKEVFNNTFIPKIYSFPDETVINSDYGKYFYDKKIGSEINYFLTDYSNDSDSLKLDASYVSFAACDN